MEVVTSALAFSLQIAGVGGAFGQKGEKGEPAVIEPVRRQKVSAVEMMGCLNVQVLVKSAEHHLFIVQHHFSVDCVSCTTVAQT